MPIRVKTTLAAVLKAARDKIVADGLLPGPGARISLNPDRIVNTTLLEVPSAIVTFNEFSQPPESVMTDGATNEVGVFRGDLIIALYLDLDPLLSDDSLMTDWQPGGVPFIESFVKRFHNSELMDQAGNYILQTSLTFLSVRLEGAVRGGQFRQPPGDRVIQRIDLRFQAAFDWDLTTAA